MNKNFKDVYQEISGKLDFEKDGMKIVYPTTPDDVIAEGHALRHCMVCANAQTKTDRFIRLKSGTRKPSRCGE